MPDIIAFRIRELLLQALVHERGGTLVYSTALECALNEQLREEWEIYLEQTIRHVDILTGVCIAIGIDPDEFTPGCQIVQHNGRALVIAMKMALANGDREAAQVVACECVVLAETKDHANWELIGECAKQLDIDATSLLQEAYGEVEEEEREHLYHTKAWCRELWLKSLGLEAQLPPPEETQHVETAIEATRVNKARKNESRPRRSGDVPRSA